MAGICVYLFVAAMERDSNWTHVVNEANVKCVVISDSDRLYCAAK